MNIQDEFLEEVEQETNAKKIIEKIRELKSIQDKWEVVIKLKELALEISFLSASDSISVISFAKQALSLRADDIKALKIEVNRLSHQNMVRKHNTELDLNENGKPSPTDKNLISIFKNDPEISGCFCKNNFSNEIDVPHGGKWYIQNGSFPRTLKNDDLNQLKEYLINKYDACFKIIQIDEAVQTLAVINHYDPLLDYLNPLQWDGTTRCETWLIDYCGAIDNAYTRFVSKLVLVAAVARAYVPGIKYDHVLVLAGDQSVMKSTLIETLAGKQFFNEITLSDNEKNTIQQMQGCWIIELPEGMPFKKKEINELKNFITAKKNKERFAFERRMEQYHRRSIFIMTINPTSMGYLSDPTGNRRFLPVRMNGDINIPAISENRDQLFAEAKHLFQNGFKIYIDKNDIPVAEGLSIEHDLAETVDEWEKNIILWLTGGSDQFHPVPSSVTCCDIWVKCLGGQISTYRQLVEGSRIGRILTKLGCKYSSERINRIPIKGYRTAEVIEKLKQTLNDDLSNQLVSFEDF